MVKAVVRQWSDEDGWGPFDAIAEVFELGHPTDVRSVAGGLSDEVWKVDTNTGALRSR